MSLEPYETTHLNHGVAFHHSSDGMKAHVTVGGRRVKSFGGAKGHETAWMDAQRHAMDLSMKAQLNDKSGHLGSL